jgi:hypothetical protein
MAGAPFGTGASFDVTLISLSSVSHKAMTFAELSPLKSA